MAVTFVWENDMKKNWFYALITVIVLGFSVALLVRLTRCCVQPRVIEHYVYVTSQPTQTSTFTPSPTRWMTATITPTTDFVALGLPSPTTTPTMNYAELVKIYLNTPTPFPTHPTPTPSPTPVDPLTLVVARRMPPEWTPTPFQLIEHNGNATAWEVGIIQIATDLMNWVDADPIQFRRQIKLLQPEGIYFGNMHEWLLKDDFDGDQQPEWLISVPAYPANKEVQAYPEQIIILFEIRNGVYQPVMHYRTFMYGGSLHGTFAKVLLVQDLNKNGLKEIAWRYITCGTACGEYILIGEWDGKNWHYTFRESIPGASIANYFMFVDKDADGLIEITLNYTTFFKLNQRYPEREAADTYGWRNGQWVLLDEWRSPSADSYAVMYDVYSALELGKIEQAIELGQPVINDLQNSCGPVETYTGLEVMFAYSMQNNAQEARAILQKLDTYCVSPENIFLSAAHVYMEAYRQVGGTITACSAANRYIRNSGKSQLELYRDFGNGYYLTFCPISPTWQ